MMSLRDQTIWRVSRNDENDDVIQGKYGTIWQYKDEYLDVWVKSVKIANKIERVLGWKARNHYDDGALFIRSLEDLHSAAKAIKAKRRKRISKEHLAKLQKSRIKALSTQKTLSTGGDKADKMGLGYQNGGN